MPAGIDRELAARIIKAGYDIEFRHDLQICTRYDQSFLKLLRRKWWHGSGMAQVYAMHGDILGKWEMKDWVRYFYNALLNPDKEFRKDLDARLYYCATSVVYDISVLSHSKKFV